MKHLSILSALFFVLQTSAFAQSNTTVIVPAPAKAAAAPSTGAATSTADAAPAQQTVAVTYDAIMYGPGLDNGEKKAENKMTGAKQMDGESDMHISHRPKLKYNISSNIDAGIQARIGTDFTGTGLTAANENWRLFANFKNVFQRDIVSVTFTPRVVLPFSDRAHNSKMLPSPELLIPVSITPKNSRFNFSYTPQMIQNLYSDATAATAQRAVGFHFIHNIEGTYTLGSATQLTFGLYPEYRTTKVAAFTNTSNELDLGVNWDFTKGWSVNPYIGTELNGLDSSAISKNMQANLTLTGTFL